MTLVEGRDRWAALVGAAQRGDASAWPELIDRFEDIAVASAVGLCGDLDEAPDIAQEAFVLAFCHIAGLRDPAAFPAWLLRLVRTATNRRTRRRRPDTVSLDAVARGDGPGALVDPAAGPEEIVLGAVEVAEVRAAVERLPEGERCVVALHHLAEMPYADVAAFLGITVAAAKKRAWSARARLKELLPMVADALAAARPSRTESFRDTILVFQALRAQDADALGRLLARNPSLATATEDWSPLEGFDARLGFSERASALIRAAGIGDLALVRLLVEAGAPVADPAHARATRARCGRPRPRCPRSSTPSRACSASEVQSFSRWEGRAVLVTASMYSRPFHPVFHASCGDTATATPPRPRGGRNRVAPKCLLKALWCPHLLRPSAYSASRTAFEMQGRRRARTTGAPRRQVAGSARNNFWRLRDR